MLISSSSSIKPIFIMYITAKGMLASNSQISHSTSSMSSNGPTNYANVISAVQTTFLVGLDEYNSATAPSHLNYSSPNDPINVLKFLPRYFNSLKPRRLIFDPFSVLLFFSLTPTPPVSLLARTPKSPNRSSSLTARSATSWAPFSRSLDKIPTNEEC